MNLDRLKARLSLDEGRRKQPYRCSAGKLTVGVGRNLDDRGLREDEIDLLLANDIRDSIGECRRLVRSFDQISDVRQEVLVNMMFNLGYARMSGFKKFLEAVSRSDWTEASNQMLDSKWADQVGDRADRLAKAMRTGAF